MQQASDEVIIHGGLPGLWEALRAASGLAAVTALTLAVIYMTLHDGSESRAFPGTFAHSAVAANASNQTPRSAATGAASAPAQPRQVVFYLVATAEQARVIEWGELQAAVEADAGGYSLPDRGYHILFASSDEDLRGASAELLTFVLGLQHAVAIKVVDVRHMIAGGQQAPLTYAR